MALVAHDQTDLGLAVLELVNHRPKLHGPEGQKLTSQRPSGEGHAAETETDLLVSDDEHLVSTRGRKLLDVRLVPVADKYALQDHSTESANRGLGQAMEDCDSRSCLARACAEVAEEASAMLCDGHVGPTDDSDTDHLWNSFFQFSVRLTGQTINALPILQNRVG